MVLIFLIWMQHKERIVANLEACDKCGVDSHNLTSTNEGYVCESCIEGFSECAECYEYYRDECMKHFVVLNVSVCDDCVENS